MLVKEYEGKSEKDALKIALDDLNLSEEHVRVEVLDKGKRSILGIGETSPARIRVYYEEISTAMAELTEIVEEIISKMGIEAKAEAREEGEHRIYINVDSEESALLIGKKGSTLEALQFIVSLSASRIFGEEEDYHVLLDVEGYRKRREDYLRDLALRLASTVKRSRRPKTLDPMNPYERRIIHLTLQDDKDVDTRSEGEGHERKIRIIPKSGRTNNRVSKNYRY